MGFQRTGEWTCHSPKRLLCLVTLNCHTTKYNNLCRCWQANLSIRRICVVNFRPKRIVVPRRRGLHHARLVGDSALGGGRPRTCQSRRRPLGGLPTPPRHPARTTLLVYRSGFSRVGPHLWANLPPRRVGLGR